MFVLASNLRKIVLPRHREGEQRLRDDVVEVRPRHVSARLGKQVWRSPLGGQGEKLINGVLSPGPDRHLAVPHVGLRGCINPQAPHLLSR